ncbi:MAG: DUF4389 domain-containing protein [Pseudomonadota bacterium]
MIKEELREQIRENILSLNTWLRAFFMLLYAIGCYIAIIVTGIIVLFQFGVVLLTGKVNDRLVPVGQSLSIYIHQILLYLTYNSEEKPFPFDSWPTVTESHQEQVVNLPNEPEPPAKGQ